MKVNFGIDVSSVEKDLLSTAEEALQSYDSLMQAGYNLQCMHMRIQHVQMAKRVISQYGVQTYIRDIDPSDLVGLNALATGDKLHTDPSIEGFDEAVKVVIDKIKEFFTKVWNFVKRIWDRLTGSNIKTAQYIVKINSVINDSSVEESTKIVLKEGVQHDIISHLDLRNISEECIEFYNVYNKYLDKLQEHYKALDGLTNKDGFSTAARDKLNKDVDDLQGYIKKLNDLSEKIHNKRIEIQQKDKSYKSLKDAGYNKIGILQAIKLYYTLYKAGDSIHTKEQSLSKAREDLIKKWANGAAESLNISTENFMDGVRTAELSVMQAYVHKSGELQAAAMRAAVTAGTIGLIVVVIRFIYACFAAKYGWNAI